MRWSCKIFKKCFYSDTKQKVTNLQLDFNWTLSIIRFYVSSNAATFWCISAQFANYFNVKSYIFGGRDWKDLSTYLWKKTQTKSIVFLHFSSSFFTSIVIIMRFKLFFAILLESYEPFQICGYFRLKLRNRRFSNLWQTFQHKNQCSVS